jgi:hypothetical protein
LAIVLAALWKCHPKFTPGVAGTGIPRGGTDHVYENETNEYSSETVAVNPGYVFMDVGERTLVPNKPPKDECRESTFQIQENVAYACYSP